VDSRREKIESPYSGCDAIVQKSSPVKPMPFRVTQQEQKILLALAALLILGLVGVMVM
jgi:hypothetical protein